MKVAIHYVGTINEATEYALKGECLHHRTNDPPYRPSELQLEVRRIPILWDECHAYGDSLARLWAEGEPFINLEPDVAPWPGALTQMWNCPEPWCAMPIIVHGAVNERNLGCVKFSAEFIREHKDLWESYPRNDVFDWKSLDSWLYANLCPTLHHRHFPPALHMNPWHLRV